MSEALISAQGVSKKFGRRLRQALWYGLKDLGTEVTGRQPQRDNLRKGEFWALRDVSFELYAGEMLGLIGVNGAGKSSLLKLLNGLLRPDTGQIIVRGSVQALIELGAGFNPILTGRENVFVNASLLGFSEEGIQELFPRIVEFSELEHAMDLPLQNYSTGMKARLGFAIAAQLDPDILLIDEVLAVGDMAFQEKCMRRMDHLRASDKGLVFVTHSLFQIEALCDRALWLDDGRVVEFGDAQTVVRNFLDQQEEQAMQQSRAEGSLYQSRAIAATRSYLDARTASPRVDDSQGSLLIRETTILAPDGHATDEIDINQPLHIRVEYLARNRIEEPLFNLRVMHNEQPLFEAAMVVDGFGPKWIENSGMVECIIEDPRLTPKLYQLLLFVRSSDGIADVTHPQVVAHFRVRDDKWRSISGGGPMALNHIRQGPPLIAPHTWHFRSEGGGGDGQERTSNTPQAK